MDGNLDPVVPNPNYQITVDGDALGWMPRPSGSRGANVAIDEVGYWNRSLTPAEIAQLQTGYITNPPTRLTPLAIGSFTADLAAVASGDSTELRWNVPAKSTSAQISHVGDVTALTAAGGGTANILVSGTNTTTYVLTVTRLTGVLSNSVTIGAVKGVAAGWSQVDNFDFYQPDALSTNGTWQDIYSGTTYVVAPAGANRMAAVAAPSSSGGGAYLMLNDLTITAGQARTLFFRMTPEGSPVDALTHFLGVSDRVASFPYPRDSEYNAGPLTFPIWDTSNWWLGVSTNGADFISTSPYTLTAGNVYKVWIDITKVPIVNLVGSRTIDEEDHFSGYIEKEGESNRTTLFSDVISDRALNTQYEYSAHYPDDNINRLVMGKNDIDPDGMLFDNIYLSKSGFKAGTPIAAGYAGPAPTLQIQWNGSAWQIQFQGTLQLASAINGGWSNVNGATSP